MKRNTIILFQPQIPQNTGNIVRTCSVTGSDLILVPPFGFSINDRWLKRAGLDYWEGVHVQIIEEIEAYLESLEEPFYFFSSKSKKCYADVDYSEKSHLVFGSETTGLPPHFFEKWSEKFVTIPMVQGQRCLNLATSVGVGLFEACRQQNFFNSTINH